MPPRDAATRFREREVYYSFRRRHAEYQRFQLRWPVITAFDVVR
jgi:hypothetical protein